MPLLNKPKPKPNNTSEIAENLLDKINKHLFFKKVFTSGKIS